MTRDTARGIQEWGQALVAGAIAGAMACLSFVVLMLLFLLLGGAVQSLSFARTGAIGGQVRSITEVLIAGLSASLANAWRFLWQARMGAAALAALGILYALTERLAWRRGWVYRWSYTFAASLWAVTTLVVTAQLWQRAQVAVWVVEHPGAFSIAHLLLSSLGTLYLLGVGAALIVGYFTWEAWRWWYMRLFALSRAERPREAPPGPQLDQDVSWREYTDRLHRLKRDQPTGEGALSSEATLVGRDVRALLLYGSGMLLAMVSLWWATTVYQAVGPRVSRATVWVEPEAPHGVLPIAIDRAAHRANISNIHGEGRVRVWLAKDAEGTQAVRSGQPLILTDDPKQITDATIDLQALPPGRYYLHMELEDPQSAGGQLRLAVLYDSLPATRPVALWAGASLGAMLSLGFLLAREWLSSRSSAP
ncbi:MAG: hypothetical protein GXP39_04775 [Chloroflexi bacterium]|nr:hypothetical protein [Chloroflexota bacterium]